MDPLAEKRRHNIAGYLISMWHVEDLMRACGFDVDAMDRLLVAPMDADAEQKEAMRDWYAGIMQRMQEEGLEMSGHLAELRSLVDELEALHRSLVETLPDDDYSELYERALPGLEALQEHGGTEEDGPVTTGLTAVYGVMVLRAQGREVSAATAEAEALIRRMLEGLSERYRHMRRMPGVSLN